MTGCPDPTHRALTRLAPQVAELLVEFWIPVLLLTLDDCTMIYKDEYRSAVSRVISPLMLLTHCSPGPSPEACAALSRVWVAWSAVAGPHYLAITPRLAEGVRERSSPCPLRMGSPKEEFFPEPTPSQPPLWDDVTAKFDLFSRAFIEAVDPVEEDDDEDEESDERCFSTRRELLSLSAVFHNSEATLADHHSVHIAPAGGAAAETPANKGGRVLQGTPVRGAFRADDAVYLVSPQIRPSWQDDNELHIFALPSRVCD